ncbi:MAG: transposase, partial [Bdellovibrionaceae bacterium]|nr:transposase [Pseudobdellovibrionaceae bacterium]
YTLEFKEQILKETKEVGNVSLVCRKHNIKPSTVHEFGRTKWYEFFKTRICKVEREYDFGNTHG